MEKIKLKNNEVFEIIPMGIETNLFEKIRKFSFTSELGYSEIETAFQPENISNIGYYSVGEELLKAYADCISLKSVAKEFGKEYEDGKIADVYTVVLNLA